MCIGKYVDENITLQMSRQQKMTNNKEVETRGTKMDQSYHFTNISKAFPRKGDQKLSALLRIFPYLEDKKEIYL